MNTPRFKPGDKVSVVVPHVWKEPQPGTVLESPKTSRGRYLVKFDNGCLIDGRYHGPQSLHERFLKPREVSACSFKLSRDFTTGRATAIVKFDCPNCGKRHRRREIFLHIPANFRCVGYSLKCGFVRVVMPWAERDTWVQRNIPTIGELDNLSKDEIAAGEVRRLARRAARKGKV